MIDLATVLAIGDERRYLTALDLDRSPVGKVRLGIARPLRTDGAIRVSARDFSLRETGLLRIDIHPWPGTGRRSMTVRGQGHTLGHRIEVSSQAHLHSAGVYESYRERESESEAAKTPHKAWTRHQAASGSRANKRRASVGLFFPILFNFRALIAACMGACPVPLAPTPLRSDSRYIRWSRW